MRTSSIAVTSAIVSGFIGLTLNSLARADDSMIALDVPDGFRALGSSTGYVNVIEGAGLYVTPIDASDFDIFVEQRVIDRFKKRAYTETARYQYAGEGTGVLVQGRRVDGAMVTYTCTLVWRDNDVAALVEIEVPERANLSFAKTPCEGIRGVRHRVSD